MLLVKTYLGLSKINGIGLFAGEYIESGRNIYEKDDIFTLRFNEEEYQIALEKNRDFVLKYFWNEGNFYFVSLDDDRFMNHSDSPNTIETRMNTIARVNINKGDEITCNYNDFCELGTNW